MSVWHPSIGNWIQKSVTMHPSLWECASILWAVHLNVMLCKAIRLMVWVTNMNELGLHLINNEKNHNCPKALMKMKLFFCVLLRDNTELPDYFITWFKWSNFLSSFTKWNFTKMCFFVGFKQFLRKSKYQIIVVGTCSHFYSYL